MSQYTAEQKEKIEQLLEEGRVDLAQAQAIAYRLQNNHQPQPTGDTRASQRTAP